MKKKEETKKMISVIKRDGHRATYDRNKIVSAIQDIIEQKLMAEKKFVLAKTYIIYRLPIEYH